MRRTKCAWRRTPVNPNNERAYAAFKAGKTRKQVQEEFNMTKSQVAGLVWRRERWNADVR